MNLISFENEYVSQINLYGLERIFDHEYLMWVTITYTKMILISIVYRKQSCLDILTIKF